MSIQKHLLLVASLLFVLFVDLSYSQALPDLCHPLDKKVLLRIKAHLGNPSSLSSWDPTTDCARWNGVQVDGQGHVTYVQIHSLSFDHLPNLSGPIPSYIGKLTNLTELSIIETNMTGPIPPVLAHLTNLNLLYLYSNKFTGPIPAFLGRLKKLVNLDLSSNLLTGPIPATLAQLSNVQILELSSNQLFGPIPDFIEADSIDVSYNQLCGPIPNGRRYKHSMVLFAHNKCLCGGPFPGCK
ncbi:Polygalacturonase inhibitor [Bienertia sinuspersici]